MNSEYSSGRGDYLTEDGVAGPPINRRFSMLTPIQLSAAFKNFCANGGCEKCCIFGPFKECSKKNPFVPVGCDIIWFVYIFLADRWLLHKNPNDLSELLVEDDLQKLASSIVKMWSANAIVKNNLTNNTFGSKRPRRCESCPQCSECDKHRTSCRLYFALENYKRIFYIINHAATLRETC